MYFLLILFVAVFLISIFSTNWPTKLYHYQLMKKIGAGLGVKPDWKGLLFGGVSSEIRTAVAGKEIRIRFLEGSVDSVYADSGLEIRLPFHHELILQCYQTHSRMKPWGDFQRILTGETATDAQWIVLSNHSGEALRYWQSGQLKQLMAVRRVEQILVQPGELIVRLKNGADARTVMDVIAFIEVDGAVNSVLIDK